MNINLFIVVVFVCFSTQAPYVASLVLNLCPSCLGLLSSEMHCTLPYLGFQLCSEQERQ